MKKIPLLNHYFMAAAFLLAAFACAAQDEPRHHEHKHRQEENRFLFLVDTSAAMHIYSNAVVENVSRLLDSDMSGEFRKGDTIGLWTYNNTLHPEYPMQVWSKEDKDIISTELAAYLRARRYEQRSHLDKVLPSLENVIKNSQRVTIIWISDGEASMHGTPFDKEINGLQKKYAHELRAAHKPAVVVLVGRDGAIYDYTINYPGLVAIPHTAYPEKILETNAPVAAAATASPPENNPEPKLRVGPSIFISGPPHIVPTAAPLPAPAPAPAAPPVAAPPPQPQPVVPAPAPVVPIPVTPAPIVKQPAPVSITPLPVSAAPIATATPPPQHEAPAVVATPAPKEIPVAPTQPKTVTVDKLPAPPTPVAAPEISVAAVNPPARSQLALFVMAFSLLTIALSLVVFLIRRSRGAPPPSLISQSIDRPR